MHDPKENALQMCLYKNGHSVQQNTTINKVQSKNDILGKIISSTVCKRASINKKKINTRYQRNELRTGTCNIQINK